MPNDIKVVPDDVSEELACMMVCTLLTSPLIYPDNIIDLCSECGEAIQYRPHAPKSLPKVCMVCAKPAMDAAAAKGELHSLITKKTEREFRAYLRKKNAH